MFRPLSNELVRLEEPGHRYCVGEGLLERERPSLSFLIENGGIGPDFSHIDPDVLSNKQAIGTIVHAGIEAYLQGYPAESCLDRVRPEWSQSQQYFESFLQWAEGKRLHATYSEVPFYHPVHEYCCTPDFVGTVDDIPFLLDYKTSYKVHRAYAAQLAGQGMMFTDGLGMRHAVLHLNKIGKPAKLVPIEKIVKGRDLAFHRHTVETLARLAKLEGVYR